LPQRIGSNKNERENKVAMSNLQRQLTEHQAKEAYFNHELSMLANQLAATKREITNAMNESHSIVEQWKKLIEKREQLEEDIRDKNETMANHEQVQRTAEKFKELATNVLIKELFETEREIKSFEDKQVEALAEQREKIKLKAKLDGLKKKRDQLTRDISTNEQEYQRIDEEYDKIEHLLQKIKKKKSAVEKEKKLKQQEFDKQSAKVRKISVQREN